MTGEGPKRHWVPRLRRSLALVFALLGVTLTLLIAAEWFWVLEPRLAADAESRSNALAQAETNALAKILSGEPGERMRSDLESEIDSILLLKDPSTGLPFVLRIALSVDYDLVPAPQGSLDLVRGVADCPECFVTSVPMYHQATGALIGLARFHSSPRFLQDLVADVHGKLIWGGAATFLLIGLAWASAKRLTHQLRVAKNEADKASRAKSTFLATMSHEIRTPLNVILGMAHLLDRADLPAEQRRQVEAIRQSGDALFAVVSDVLDFSQIESGRLVLEQSEFDLTGLIKRILTIFSLRAEQKGLRLEHDIDEVPRARCIGDPNRIRQVLINLLGNAVKFTSSGWVRLEARLLGSEGGTGTVEFRISDSGIGLSPNHLSSLFDGAGQLDTGVSRQFAGTGLGLVICRRLTELMGGEIGAHGELGRGSTFWFRLPLVFLPADSQDGAASASVKDATPALSVLVVDDDVLNRMLLQSLLKKAGHRVHSAANGVEALQAIDSEPFDLVLLDLWMPEMDGFEAARRIRALPDSAIATGPIVALTADVTEETAAEARRAGVSAVFGKPLSPEKLAGLLRTYRP
jgi:signal transduction histidine kinase/CheY-like chemotaxis protein